ncbi:hypothetical protein ACFXJ8_39255 [Nonomuraea sp. NPDC059194]|uniref:hypothetical protein n=1 Tax=Nonomuraea sp. NPDC059194 TaxID=3346764 RepID=UPI00367F62C8
MPRQRTTGRDGEGDVDEGCADDGVDGFDVLAAQGEADAVAGGSEDGGGCDATCDGGALAAADVGGSGSDEGHPQIAKTNTPMKITPVITATTSR